MIKVRWDITEAVVLVAEYLKTQNYNHISDERLLLLSEMYKKKAQKAEILFDEKFRNLTGLRMQLACIHFIATNGAEGMRNASKIFYKAYDMYTKEPEKFYKIYDTFFEEYSLHD